ncbi:hypothetical protein AGMMS50212_05110 [Spirochaetia bacterium]|nr:hypothetical protein AGMMS50212_05110 [Spirochaetia bacterium]
MKSITVEIEDETLIQCMESAKQRQMPLDQWVIDILEKEVKQSKKLSLEEFFRLADSAHGNSNGWKWNREEIYDRFDK